MQTQFSAQSALIDLAQSDKLNSCATSHMHVLCYLNFFLLRWIANHRRLFRTIENANVKRSKEKNPAALKLLRQNTSTRIAR